MESSALARSFYKKSKVVLVEPLGRALRLGSVGYFTEGQWVEVTTTKKMFGLTLSASPGANAPNSFDGSGGKGFSFQLKAAAVVSDLVPKVGDARLRAEVNFGSRDGFVMSVRNQTIQAAGDLGELMAAIRWAFRQGRGLAEDRRWAKKYAVIVGIATAESVTAVSASSSKAAIVIEGVGKLPPPAAPAELDARMRITVTKRSTEKLWRGPATGYAVMALRLSPPVLRKWREEDFKYVAKAARAAPGATLDRRGQPQGPLSFTAWAKSQRMSDPSTATVTLVRASGRAATQGTAKTVLRPTTRATAIGKPAARTLTARGSRFRGINEWHDLIRWQGNHGAIKSG